MLRPEGPFSSQASVHNAKSIGKAVPASDVLVAAGGSDLELPRRSVGSRPLLIPFVND